MITVYLERLKALRDIGFPLAVKKRDIHCLDFDQYMSHDGKKGCILGWWATTDRAKEAGWAVTGGAVGRVHFAGSTGEWAAEEYFGDGYPNIFGGSTYGSLEDRLVCLNRVIAEMETQV